MTQYLLLIAVICILCIIAGNLSYRIGVPSLLLFILLGMAFGSDGIFRISFSDFALTEEICSIALIFIMFYGGFGTNWFVAKPVASKAVLLSTIGVVLTASFTGFFCFLVLKTSVLEGLLIGSVVASTDAASVFSILKAKKLNLAGGMGSLLELESGSNDPISYMLTTITLSLMSGQEHLSVPMVFLSQMVFGLFFGFLFGGLSVLILQKISFRSKEMIPILVMALALLTYAVSSRVNGNGFLSVYIAGIILGNSKICYKVELVHFFDGITGMMQIILFFLLGLLCFPSRLPALFLPALGIFLFMLFVGRPLAVCLILWPFHVPRRQRLLISWAGLRGAASIVFAIYTVISPAVMSYDIFHIVFCICLLSVALQGTLLPFVAEKLGVIDAIDNISKTFNDYQEDQSIHLSEIRLPGDHPWIHQTLRDIVFPDGSLAVILKRGAQSLVPNGDTVIQPGDILILSTPAYQDDSGIPLREVDIGTRHPWIHRTLSDLSLPKGSLAIMIKRGGQTLIPGGDTKLLLGDIMILCDQTDLMNPEKAS